jgi:hypothetical protein
LVGGLKTTVKFVEALAGTAAERAALKEMTGDVSVSAPSSGRHSHKGDARNG